MDDAALAPENVSAFFYMFAALFALTGGVFWARFVAVRAKREREGGPITTEWLTEAGAATALTLFCAGGGYLVSFFI